MPEHAPIKLAQDRLRRAVAALAEPVPLWDGGACRWTPALYARLRTALRGQPVQGGRRAVAGSRLPCRTDMLTLLFDIDTAAAEWQPEGTSTTARLQRIAAQDHAPADCERLDTIATRIEGWTLTAAELLGDVSPEVALRVPCPRCNTRFVYRQSGGEQVRTWALRVSEDGARCQHCHAAWAPDRFEFLAVLIGAPALPA